MKIGILGFGREGKSLLKFLRSRGLTRVAARIDAGNISVHQRKNQRSSAPDEIWILDKDKKTEVPKNVRTQTGKDYLKNLSRFDIVFRSPGVPYRLPEIRRAQKAGVKISSATKLFFELAPRKTTHIIGITGSKGKSTTATLLYRILKATGKNALLAGNIGTPALNLLTKPYALDPNTYVVLELSSFQLEDLAVSSHIAVVLDVFPEHQDSHGSLAEYYRAKTNISRHQKPGDAVFYFSKNPISKRIGMFGKGKKVAVSDSREWWNKENSSNATGPHTLKNYAMAATVAKYLGIPPSTIEQSIKNFRGLPHRLQLIRTIRIHPRANPRTSALIEFYDDSASHNPNAAIAAIKSFPDAAKILIAGGKNRPFDYRALGKAAKQNKIALAVLLGENKKKIGGALKVSKVPMQLRRILREAVQTAYREAKNIARKNKGARVIVLLSPGAPSYDMFKNFEERGRAFTKLVRKLK